MKKLIFIIKRTKKQRRPSGKERDGKFYEYTETGSQLERQRERERKDQKKRRLE